MLRPLPATPGRLPGLDLVRAVAILWVMAFHAHAAGLISDDHPVIAQGWIGVDLFFALSGFLIGGQLFRPFARGEPARMDRFYARRLFRTLPPYLVVLALYFALPVWREQPLIQPFWQFASFTENLFVDMRAPKAFSHVWSLCIEEQFYLVAPLLIWLLARRGTPAKAVMALTAVVLAGMAWRGFQWVHDLGPLQHLPGGDHRFWIAWQEKIYYASAARLDDLVGGLALALVKAFRPGAWSWLMRRSNMALALGAAAIGLTAWLSQQTPNLISVLVEFPILGLGTSLVVAAGASERGLIGRWRIPGAGLIAAMAYSLYLTHKEAYHLVRLAAGGALDHQPALRLLLCGGLALVVGAALYLAVERPALRWRDRVVG
jgi:peptidoglycan/LPS O-acetylase OafA/YrhL